MTAPSPTVPAPGSTVRDVLELAAGRSVGLERVALVEEAVRLAVETGDESGEVAARLELVGSYGEAGDPWRGIEPFLWCLSRRAERPDLFSDEQSAAIGRVYRWMTIVAASNPQVGVAQVRVLEQGFDAYAHEVGMSAHDLADERRIVALYLGQIEEAAGFYEDWLTTPPDPDRACETPRTIDVAAEEHDWESAVRYAVPVLDGTWTCEDQPSNVEAMTLVPVLLSGRPERAWAMHLSSYLTHRRDGAERGWLREHLAFLALSGRVDRGLRILRRHAGATAECGVAADLLELLTGAVMVLRAAVRAGRGAESLGADMPRATLGVSGHHVEATDTIAEALEITSLWLEAFCGLFDERNGNRGMSEDVARVLDLQPVTDVVLTERRVHVLREPEALPDPLPTNLVEPAPEPSVASDDELRGELRVIGDVVAVDLLRQERAVNAVLAHGDPVAATSALVALAWNLRQAGRDLEALAAVETGIDLATGAGSRRAPGRVRMLDLHCQALGALTALRDQQGVRVAALACAEACDELGEASDARMYLELAACSSLEVGEPLDAAALFRRAAEVRVDGASDGGRADLLGRALPAPRRAARASLAVASPAVRRGRADVVAQLLDLAAQGVEALAGMGDVALVEAEREALAADRAWATERTGH